MPLAPEVQQLIQQVEQLSNRPVHVMEEPRRGHRLDIAAEYAEARRAHDGAR